MTSSKEIEFSKAVTESSLDKGEDDSKGPEKVYNTPFEIHEEFVKDVSAIVGWPEGDVRYQFVITPSSVRDLIIDRWSKAVEISIAFISPIEKDNEIIGLAIGSEGNSITPERVIVMEAETRAESEKAVIAELDQFYDHVEKCNSRMRELAKRHNYTVSLMYQEINARGWRLFRDQADFISEKNRERIETFMKEHPGSWWDTGKAPTLQCT